MSQPRSFQLRIALLASALAGMALVGFGGLSGWQIYRAKLSRLDAELLNQLIRANHPPDILHWQLYAKTLPQFLGATTEDAVAVLALRRDRTILYQTPTVQSDPLLQDALTRNLESTPLKLPPFRPPRPPNFAPPPPDVRPPVRIPQAPEFITVRSVNGSWRLGSVQFPNVSVAIAVNLNTLDQEMLSIWTIFLISIPGILIVIAGAAWGLAGQALSPIRQLTGIIQQVSATGLDQRVPMGAIDVEFMELIQVFNQMMQRLERSFQQASRFSADAAHELKTPLTILQGELERTLQQTPPGSEIQQQISHLLDEVSRLSGIVRKLLLLSLADAGQMRLYVVELDLGTLLAEMLEDLELQAPHLTVQTHLLPGLTVPGDRVLLTQVLQNLFSNAVKYNIPDGSIQVTTQVQGQAVRITITNTSNEIPTSDRDRIFTRFYRGDPARTRTIEGLGLGLSLAREIAWAHQGNLTLDASESGQTTFTLTLPLRTGG